MHMILKCSKNFLYLVKVSGIPKRLLISATYLQQDVASPSELSMNSAAEMLDFLSFFPVFIIMLTSHCYVSRKDSITVAASVINY